MSNKCTDQTARAGWSVPLLFSNTEDRFYYIEAQLILGSNRVFHALAFKPGPEEDVKT